MYRYINDDMLEKIYEEYPKCFGIRFNENIIVNGKCVGQVLLLSGVTKKTIGYNSRVKFLKEKIKYITGENNGSKLCVINQYWVKPFINNPKLKFKIKVLKSKLNETTNERVYFYDLEEIELTYSQYIMRNMIIDFGNYKHQIICAYENFKQRYGLHHNYYRALNETCKNYLIKHDMLKSILSRIDNTKKKYKKEWTKEYIKHLEINRDQRIIDELFKDSKVEKDKSNIVQFKKEVYNSKSRTIP